MDSSKQPLSLIESEAAHNPFSSGVACYEPLTDGQLLLETLLVTDVAELEGALSERPPSGTEARLLKYYKLPKSQAIRCCFCKQRQKHQVGYLCTFGTAERYLVGNVCGVEVLGNGFKISAKRIQDDIARQTLMARLVAINGRSDQMLAWCNSVLFSECLREIEAAAREIHDVSADLFIRLRASAMSGEMLSISEQVRDIAREFAQDNRGKPVFKTVQKDIGVLNGTGLFKASEIRTEVHALKREITGLTSALQSLRHGPLASKTNFRKQLKALTSAHENARKAASDIASASRFYAQSNLRLVASVFSKAGQLELEATSLGLRIEVLNKGEYVIRSRTFADLPPIPRL